MATQFPIDPEFDRFIDGLKSNPDGSVDVEVEDQMGDVEELEDGSAIVHMGGDEEEGGEPDFYENLAEEIGRAHV